jgi:hypothetical protein
MGSSTYDGTVRLQADNGNATFALTGDARVNVGWGAANDVDTRFDELEGRRNDGIGSGSNVDFNNVIRIDDAGMTGTTFSGGTLTVTGSDPDLAYSGGGTVTHEGQFFGPDATEVGGVFVLDSASLDMSGVFIANGDRD